MRALSQLLTFDMHWIFHNICSADGHVAACVDVLQITHAAISMVRPILLLSYVAKY